LFEVVIVANERESYRGVFFSRYIEDQLDGSSQFDKQVFYNAMLWVSAEAPRRTIDELRTKIEELGTEGQIDNQGIVESLIAKLNTVQKLVEKEKADEARIVLEEFILQVQELSEIHITGETAEILIRSAEYIASHL